MQHFLGEADDGVLCVILSFLPPRDIASCAGVCRRFRSLCFRDNPDLWRALCHRRWAGFTSLSDWAKIPLGGALGFTQYRGLYKLLAKWGGLIGFWRGVRIDGHRSQLLEFQWSKNSIHGFLTVPAQKGSYQVRRIPFLCLGAAENGREICVMDPVTLDEKYSCCSCHLSKVVENAGADLGPSSSGQGIESVFTSTETDWDVEDLSRLGLFQVDIHFAGKNHIVLEQANCPRQVVVRKKMLLADAVASASLGFSSAGREDGNSPPGSFSYEMYRFVTSKVTSPGSDRAARKQWKRDKERAESRRTLLWLEQLHFVKVVDLSPTKARPFQGLWKGLCRCENLDFMLVSYDDQGEITARKICESSSRRSTWMNLSEQNFQQTSRDASRWRLLETNSSTEYRTLLSSGKLLDVTN